MNYKKNVSKLSDHILIKKKGIVSTPLNYGLSDMLSLSSWTKERMPEYLWLGLILLYYGRRDGLDKACQILCEISKRIKSLSYPQFSMILNLSYEKQNLVYDIISNKIKKKILSPLTILYRNKNYSLFNEYFYDSQFKVEDRINILLRAIKLYSNHQANEATDLRFLALCLMIFNDRLHMPKNTANALNEYPYTDHEDEKMKIYRPTVRSMEGIGIKNNDIYFIKNFWRNIGMITPCNPIMIKFDENKKDFNEFIRKFKKILEYVLASNKEKSLFEDKFDVIVGSINYALKIFDEINSHSLGNSIIGRHAIRTIIEVYIIIKYLLKKESENPKIWEEYKLYGISKLKLILLKARETKLDRSSHFMPPIVDALVNEIKWEEFIDVDLKYFDKQGIREKFIEVGEKELFDLFYDYDSNYSHGLWSAIRESTMLNCDNAAHQYHSIPDIYYNQKLPDVKSDSLKIIKKVLSILTEIYEVPDTILEDLGDEK